jgi:uncharacterized membrane protein
MSPEQIAHGGHPIQRYLLTGIVTVIPLWVTWWVFTFVLDQLSRVGAPWVRAAARAVEPHLPMAARWLQHEWFQFAAAIVLTLAGLIALGWLASKVIGRRLLALVDRLMHAIPLAERIYGATRKLLSALQERPEEVQRVVLIPFPSPEMKTVGFVTRVFQDHHSGDQLAAVYVPTTPNPTSGYLEIVPIGLLVETGWTVDEAMSFIISGGTVAPESVRYADPMQACPVGPEPESHAEASRRP